MELLSKIGEASHTPLCKVNYNANVEESEIVKQLSDMIKRMADGVSEDDVMMVALDNGADDVVSDDECFEIITAPDTLHNVAKACEAACYEVVSSEVEYVPQNQIELDKDSAISVNKLVLALEDLDDVQNVYTSAELSVLDE